MSDITDLLSAEAFSSITNWNITGTVWDVFTLLTASTLLLVAMAGFSLYLLFMSRDTANKDRLLNVLYGNLCVCHTVMSVLMFSHYLELQTLGTAPTLLSCVSDRCRLFLNPGLYLQLSLHWRRIPTLCLQFIITSLVLGTIELSTGFEEFCISVKTKETYNLIIMLSLYDPSTWGCWRNCYLSHFMCQGLFKEMELPSSASLFSVISSSILKNSVPILLRIS